MAQPHPSHLFQPTTRPCWHCGTRHKSDTTPALCSDPCREAWAKLYTLQYGEEPSMFAPSGTEPSKHTNHGCSLEPLLDVKHHSNCSCFARLGTTFAEATAGLEALKSAVHAEQERMNAEARGVDEPQDLLDNTPSFLAVPAVPTRFSKTERSWWQRLFRRPA